MPEPIQSSANSSVYDPGTEMSLADACDPSVSTCADQPPTSKNVVTVEPVVVEGDAGVQALLRRHAADQCLDEKGDAVLSCTVTILAGAKAVVTASTRVVGLPVVVLEAGIAALAAANCARVVVAHQACVEKHEARTDVGVQCRAEGGTLTVNEGAGELLCLVER